MAYVKIYFVKHAQNVLEYVQREKAPGDPVSTTGFEAERATETFKQINHLHGDKGAVQAIHVIQSWTAEDSKKFDREKFQELGQTLASRYFKGHQFLITTHTNTKKTHNHIVVSPWNTETGKKIENKKYHLYKLRDLSNDISKQHGLSIIQSKGHQQNANLPDRVKRMIRFNGRSYLLDLMQKADFARAYATSFDDYTSILKEFDITAKVQNKNITYLYPGRKKGKRGNKLGKLYDKTGLVDTFKENHKRIQANPQLQQLVQKEISQVRSDPESLSRKLVHLFAPSNRFKEMAGASHGQQAKMHTSKIQTSSSDQELRTQLVPSKEIQHAKQKSIIEYAKRNRIGLTKNQDDSFHLTKKPYVEIHETKWINKKNRTQGSLIDFVAAHKNISFLQAISEINNAPRLLLLEKHLGEQKRTFTSFYLPKDKRLNGQKAVEKMAFFLRGIGGNPEHAGELLRWEKIHITKNGSVRLFLEDDNTRAIEFYQDKSGGWKRRNLGKNKSILGNIARKQAKAIVFTDPFSLFRHGGIHKTARYNRDADVLALTNNDSHAIDHFVKQHTNIKEISLVPPARKENAHEQNGLMFNLQARYSDRNISVNLFSPDNESKGKSIGSVSL